MSPTWSGLPKACLLPDVAELRNILIEDYEMTVDDFLVVFEGEAVIHCEGEATPIGPGDALFIPNGSVVSFEVAHRLLWSYAATPADSRAGLKQPKILAELTDESP